MGGGGERGGGRPNRDHIIIKNYKKAPRVCLTEAKVEQDRQEHELHEVGASIPGLHCWYTLTIIPQCQP